jgi:transcriptional regulator with XRE-family HTH domain
MSRRRTITPDAKKFGALVRSLRIKRGLTQESLALDAGLSSDFVGFVERGENLPSLSTILQLAGALRVKPSYMVRLFDT